MVYRTLVTIVDGLHYRYLVQSGILADIISNSSLVLVYAQRDLIARFAALGLDERVELQPIPDAPINRSRFFHLFLRSCANRTLTGTLNIKAEIQRKGQPLRFHLRRLLGHVVAITGLDLSCLLNASWKNPDIHRVMHKRGINLLIVSTPGQKVEDIPFLYSARQLSIESVSPVYSWDNLTAKGPFAINPDRLVVWNKMMQEEARIYHGYDKRAVDVGGVPVFDTYAEVATELSSESRAAFLERLGLNPAKRLITLTTIPPVYFGRSHRILADRIISWIRSGLLPASSLIIRPHPLDDTDYDDLTTSDVVLDTYGSTPNADPRRWTPADDNTRHLGHTMAYSDVVINIASTITVDAACFDTPIINVAYDEKPRGNEYCGSISRYYNYTHYRQVVETGAAVMVHSPEELLSAIQSYFNDRSRNRINRAVLVEKQVGVLDGGASKRTAAALLRIDTSSLSD
jgi:hypothetical protein